MQFFENILNWLKELFGVSNGVDEAVDNAKDTVTNFTGGIFDNIKQSDKIKIDSGIWSSDETETGETSITDPANTEE